MAETSSPHARVDVVRAVKDAAWTGLVAFGLFLPLIGFLTFTNMRNEIELETRLPLLAWCVAIIVAGRLAHALVIAPWLAHRAEQPPSPRVAAFQAAVGKWFTPFALGLVIV